MNTRFQTEDWWALWIGLALFALSLGVLGGADLLGWGAETKVWSSLDRALGPVSKNYEGVPGLFSLMFTFTCLLTLMGLGAWAQGWRVGKFLVGFTAVFWISYLCWLAGHNAFVAATPKERSNLGIPWSLGLTGEAGYIVALAVGLAIGNLLPRVSAAFKEATRPEWYIKTAIVLLGAWFGAKATGNAQLTKAIFFRGFAAIVEAYLIYWALVYLVARTFFRFSREWAAPLASGISICGVSAAIATGAAIRARPIVPIMVSSLVVVFSVVELLLLPFLAQTILPNEPMVAAAWMGLAVKTDGAANASGAVTEALFKSAAEQPFRADWMLMTTTTVKVFIDVFIGVWAFVLAAVWNYGIHKTPGERPPLADIWERFPKFVLGYLLTFAVMFAIAFNLGGLEGKLDLAAKESNVFRSLFFVMTFFTIGLASNFKKLWEEGIGRLAAVYLVSLFGFIIWIGLAISWIFFHGLRPPLAGGAN